MARTLEKRVVDAIELAIDTAYKSGRGPDMRAIAAVFNCTYSSVCRIRNRMLRFARTGVDDRKKPGPKPMADQPRMIEAVRELLARRPELDQSAVADYVFDKFGVRVCRPTISRWLTRTGIPHKVSNKLYKNSKLVSTQPTQPTGHVIGEYESTQLAASALSMLPNTPSGRTYTSPYSSSDTASKPLTYRSPYGDPGSLS